MGKVNLGKVKGEDGKNVFIKYNVLPMDENASEIWQEGMGYIGFAFASGDIAPSSGYRWAKFVGPQGAAGLNGTTGANGRQGADGNGIYVSSQAFGTGVERYDVSSVSYKKSELAAGDLIISAQNCNVVSVRSLTSDGFTFIGEYLFNIKGTAADSGNFVTKGAFRLEGDTLVITV
ncbi:MAG: hypothetical protein NC132_02400 [Corallococcus sp.]|nr:hypothetical protein [Corallococcus sp.]MCM1358959.1 hypothetical protein [Corallococcus sp.]MCM1394948.1 hypothetical protein [Corallococcus sp.]